MGVYIQGMEMPVNCASCPVYRFGCTMDGDCWNLCAACGKELNNHFGIERPYWCPLVPVPPHGRLGDLDALRQDWLENGENECVYDTNAFLGSLDDAPTIIPAEEGAPEQDGGDG